MPGDSAGRGPPEDPSPAGRADAGAVAPPGASAEVSEQPAVAPGPVPLGPVPLGWAAAVGAGAFFLIPQMPPAWVGWPLAALVLALAWPRRPRWSRPLAALLAGALWALLRTGPTLWEPFPEELARSPLTVEGRIVSIPADTGLARRFLFRVDRTLSGASEVRFGGLVRLSWHEESPALEAGQRWRLPVRLKPRHGFANPGGFDFERWLFEQGILATGSIRQGAGKGEDAGETPHLLDPGPGAQWLTRIRQSFAEHLALILPGARALGLVQALTIGERGGLSPEDWETLTRTGTNHLVAISGLHVGLVAAAAFFLVRRTWALLPALALRLAAPRAAALAGGVAACLYAGLAGFSVSTQRSLVMLAVVLGAVLGAVLWVRTLRPWHAFSLAVVGVLLLDPRAVLSYGAWLSFGAVAVLLFNLGQRLPSRDLWTRWGRAQWAVAIGLLPLLLLLFGRASVVAAPVNLVAVPLFSFLLLPPVLVASLLSLVPGLTLPLVWTADLLGWCLAGLEWVADLPWAAGTLSERPAWAWAAAFAGVALLLAPRGLPGRWLGLVLLLPLAALRPPTPGPGEAWMTLLDVGQGLSAVVRTASGTLVYDTGPGYESGFSTGTLVVAPFLAAQGVRRMDVLVLSHADRDHAGGAGGLLARVPAGRILSGEPQALALQGAEPCTAGEEWEWSGVRFRFLHPQAASQTSGNDASCVLRVEVGGRSVLLPGDISRSVEGRLAREMPAVLRSDILVAGHHGSNTSTGAPFLDAVRPSLVLYCAGFANPFGFPSGQVRERVAARGIPALDTGTAGAVEIRLAADGTVKGPWAWRERAGRLWTHRPKVRPD